MTFETVWPIEILWILSKNSTWLLLKKQQLGSLCIKGFLMKCWILSGTCSNHCVRYRFLNFRLLLTYHWAEKEVKEECAFNYPRLSFNLIYYRTLRSLPSPVFLSSRSFFRGEFRFECCVVTARNQMVFRCCLKKQNVCQKSSFFSFLLSCCYTVFQLPDFCPKIQVFKDIWIFARKIGTLSFLV